MAFFNIPTDVYQKSYSGFDPKIKSQLLPQLTQQFGQQPLFGYGDIDRYVKKASDAYKPAFGMVSGAFSKARESLPALYRNTLIPSTQNVLNNLVSRGILNSSMGSDAISNMNRRVAGDIAGRQAGLYGQEADILSRLAGMQAGAGNQLMVDLLGQILNRESRNKGLLAGLLSDMGRYNESSSPFQPYQAMIDLLQRQY